MEMNSDSDDVRDFDQRSVDSQATELVPSECYADLTDDDDATVLVDDPEYGTELADDEHGTEDSKAYFLDSEIAALGCLNREMPKLEPEVFINAWLNNAVIEGVSDTVQQLNNQSDTPANEQNASPETTVGVVTKKLRKQKQKHVPSAGIAGKSRKLKIRKQVICEICNLSLCGVDSLERHQKYQHCTAEEKEKLKEQCKICEVKFLGLTRHMWLCHSVDVRKRKTKPKPDRYTTWTKRHCVGPNNLVDDSVRPISSVGVVKLCHVCGIWISDKSLKRHIRLRHG